MRFFIGLSNIASMGYDLKRSFEKNGHEVFVVTYTRDSKITRGYTDFDIQKAKNRVGYFRPGRISVRIKPIWDKLVEKWALRSAMKQADIFIFFWNSFYEDYSDLKILKDAGKKIICVFVGDDVRWYYAMKQEFAFYGLDPIEYSEEYDYSLNGLEKRLLYLRTAEKYADFIFSRVDQAQLQLRPYYRWNMMVNSEEFKNAPEQRRTRPVIVHAPSNRKVKGTDYIVDALERLKAEGVEFDYVFLENVKNEDAIKIYGNADILIDQLLCPGSGKLATEALACGTIVLSLMAYENYPQFNPKECPIIDVNRTNIYTKLKEIILDYDFRVRHAKLGRKYVEKVLEIDLFTAKVARLSAGEKIGFDYFPSFFREKYVAQSNIETHMLNNWTDFIKDCDWYKRHIAAGSREGLVF